MFPHCKDQLLRAYPAFDFLCTGEGELTMAELAQGMDPAEIKGLIWRQGSAGDYKSAPPPNSRFGLSPVSRL